MEQIRTINEINNKISKGEAVVIGVDEFKKVCATEGIKKAAEKIDVVTCATFSPTCGTGIMMNLGHTNPPIKFKEAYFNNVRAYTGFTSVDAYIGSDQPSEDNNINIHYGGAHVMEDLLNKKTIHFKAVGFGPRCHSYPREDVETYISLDDINEVFFIAHRFCVQKGSGYVNSSSKKIGTYKGIVFPSFSNCVYTGTGELNPLINDIDGEVIGIGTRILLSGAQGYIIGEGTQHNPEKTASTTMLRCRFRDINPKYFRAVVFENYASSLYIGLAVPIPILNIKIAKNCAIRDHEIQTVIKDAGDQEHWEGEKPVICKISYQELKSGKIKLPNGKTIVSTTVSSVMMAKKIMRELKQQIVDKKFYLTPCLEKIPQPPYKSLKTFKVDESFVGLKKGKDDYVDKKKS